MMAEECHNVIKIKGKREHRLEGKISFGIKTNIYGVIHSQEANQKIISIKYLTFHNELEICCSTFVAFS